MGLSRSLRMGMGYWWGGFVVEMVLLFVVGWLGGCWL